jgi:hypothetical protein
MMKLMTIPQTNTPTTSEQPRRALYAPVVVFYKYTFHGILTNTVRN